MNKRELHKAMQEEMTFAANKLVELKAKEEKIIRDIDYWTRQEEAARVVAIRLDIEASQSEPSGERNE